VTIRVVTYLRTAEGSFIPFSEAPARPPETPGDIEGSVELTVDGTAVLTKETWDAVDLLWIFLCRLVKEFVDTGSATTSYPEQQVEIGLRRISRPGWALVSRGTTDHEPAVRAAAPERELLASLLHGAEEFFARLDEVAPPRPSYAEALRVIRAAIGGD
jgi:hypothetical protein